MKRKHKQRNLYEEDGREEINNPLDGTLRNDTNRQLPFLDY